MHADSPPCVRYQGWNWCHACKATADIEQVGLVPGQSVVCRGCRTNYVFDAEEDAGTFVLLEESS